MFCFSCYQVFNNLDSVQFDHKDKPFVLENCEIN